MNILKSHKFEKKNVYNFLLKIDKSITCLDIITINIQGCINVNDMYFYLRIVFIVGIKKNRHLENMVLMESVQLNSLRYNVIGAFC